MTKTFWSLPTNKAQLLFAGKIPRMSTFTTSCFMMKSYAAMAEKQVPPQPKFSLHDHCAALNTLGNGFRTHLEPDRPEESQICCHFTNAGTGSKANWRQWEISNKPCYLKLPRRGGRFR